MTRRAASRAVSFLLGEASDVVLDEALDLFLRELLAEGRHVLAALRNLLDQLIVLLGGLPFLVGEIARHELLALGSIACPILPVALGAVFEEESRGVLIGGKERDDADRRDRAEHQGTQDPNLLHVFLSFIPFGCSRDRGGCVPAARSPRSRSWKDGPEGPEPPPPGNGSSGRARGNTGRRDSTPPGQRPAATLSGTSIASGPRPPFSRNRPAPPACRARDPR